MSYEVLTQKWRPQKFSDVVGQEHVITTLKNQILNDQIGHAYIFHGPRGTGKTTVARIFAKSINCPNRQVDTEFSHQVSPEPCNKCDICMSITNGTCFDVTEMDAASNRGIDEIRGLRERVKLAPNLCQYKVYIIDEAHMLTTEAFNAFLKTLEEPPKHVIFILITTELHKILTTISSRCQKYGFRYLSHSQIASHLKQLCESEEFFVAEDGLELIARESEGCLRDAQNLLEQLFAASGDNKEISLDDLSRLLGFGSIGLINNLVEQIIERNTENCLVLVNQIAEQGADLSQSLKTLIADFRNLRLLSVGHKLEEIIDVSQTRLEWMKNQTENISIQRIQKIIKILMKAENDIKQHGYELINLESALIEACSIQEGIRLTEAFEKLIKIQSMLEEMSRTENLANMSLQKQIMDSNESVQNGPVDNEATEDKEVKQLVYPLPEAILNLSTEDIINKLADWLDKNGNIDLTRNIKRAEIEKENGQLVLKFYSNLWYNFVKEGNTIVSKAVQEIANSNEIKKNKYEHNEDDKSFNFIENESIPVDEDLEDSFIENDISDNTINEKQDSQISKHKLFDKAIQDKIISHAINKFKGVIVDVNPK